MREWYRRQTPEKKKAMYAARDPEVARRSDRKRWGTEKRRASLRDASKTAYIRNHEQGKVPARRAVAYAVSTGKLRKEPCQECGTWLVQAHHHNGYEPAHYLDVVWLCVRHHKAAHGHLREAA
jgi:hypothetical protein